MSTIIIIDNDAQNARTVVQNHQPTDLSEELSRLLAEMPERSREVLLLWMRCCFSMRGAAERLGISEQRFSQLVARAKKHAREVAFSHHVYSVLDFSIQESDNN